jgi:thymidylate synthase (FAD)
MKIELLDGTTEFPLQKCGYNAGVCWGAPLDDKEKNIKRAISCIKAGHGRVMEYVDIELVISDVSARCLRELYTHIGGAPTRLQASTRYISEQDGFDYYTPPKIDNNIAAKQMYIEGMGTIQKVYNGLLEEGMTKEDAANVLPLGMMSKMVWKVNLRTLINFCNVRSCTRALKEIRDLTKEIVSLLGSKNEEWAWIAENLLVPKCEQYKYINDSFCFCTEQQCCGKHPKITDLQIIKK